MHDEVSGISEQQERNEADKYGGTNVSYFDEREIWAGRPSQWVNFGLYLFWIVFIGAFSYVYYMWSKGQIPYRMVYTVETVKYFPILFYSLVGLAAFSMLMSYLSVRQEVTIITMNKILERRGITRMFRRELYCELSDVEDIQSPPPGIMGLVGLSSLVIMTKDNDQPVIRIRAIKKRDELIKKLLPVWRELKIARRGYFGDTGR